MTYKITYEEIPWECEELGYGRHYIVKLYMGDDLRYTWSYNGKYGGKLLDEGFEFPASMDFDYEPFAWGLLNGLSIAGCSVYLEGLENEG